MLRRLPRALLVGALVAGGLVTTSGTALAELPDPDRWGPEIEDYTGWDDRADGCISGARPGVKEVEKLVQEELGLSDWATNIPRGCQGGGSEHEEGRALDIMLDANDPDDHAKADRLIDWLLATDEHGNQHAMARRLGVMYIIWDGQSWESDDKYSTPGWSSYGGSSPHTDHIHISFDWPGARGETSFFDPPPLTPPCEFGWQEASSGGVTVDRANGCDRFETSALLARQMGSADTVYVATGTDYPDALAATPPAAAEGAPVLLTMPTDLHPATRDALERIDPSRVVVLGGDSAVSEDVERELEAFGSVERISGSDRWETAADLAADGPSDEVAYLASGTGFADALSGGAAAGHEGRPLLITRPDDLVDPTAAALDGLTPQRLVALGGSVAIEDGTLAAAADRVDADRGRRHGRNRWQTSATIAKQSFDEADTVVLATGEGYADALTAASLAANQGAPLLLTPSGRLAKAAENQIERLSPSRIVVAGGESAVAERVLAEARQAAGG